MMGTHFRSTRHRSESLLSDLLFPTRQQSKQACLVCSRPGSQSRSPKMVAMQSMRHHPLPPRGTAQRKKRKTSTSLNLALMTTVIPDRMTPKYPGRRTIQPKKRKRKRIVARNVLGNKSSFSCNRNCLRSLASVLANATGKWPLPWQKR